MTPEDIEAARRLMEWPGFKWAEGMKWINPDLYPPDEFGADATQEGVILSCGYYRSDTVVDYSAWVKEGEVPAGALPDITHPATQGILQRWLIEAWPSEYDLTLGWSSVDGGRRFGLDIWVDCIDGHVGFAVDDQPADALGRTLVTALLAAPEKA